MELMSGEAARIRLDLPPRAGMRLFGDDRLARLAAGGDRHALGAIYRRHHQELYRYCRAILRDPDDAEDALQATMAKVASALPGETREIALRPWLFRIAHNEAISILRARRPTVELDDEQPSLGADVERHAEERDRLRRLVVDLDQLPERQRGALIMRELSGSSFEDVGAAFAITPAAAKQAVYEARVALQQMAEGREMDCDLVRQTISDGDRRTLRGRRLRAHLKDCDGCADFAAAIDHRRADLAALAPPIALPAALAALQAALGAGSTGTVAGGSAATGSVAGIGAALSGSAAVKSAAVLIAAAAIGGGAAEVGGLVDLGGSGDRSDRGASAVPASADQPAGASGSAAGAGSGAPAAQGSTRADASGSPNAGAGRDGQRRHGGNAGHGHANHGGPPAHAAQGAPAASPSPPGHAGTAPGQQQTSSSGQGQALGHGGASAAPQSTSHANPQAQVNSSSPSHSQAGSAAHGGGSSTAPGPTGAVVPTPRGNARGQTTDSEPE
jgi:RNA polymerase sigma factor (sigma-70 family)